MMESTSTYQAVQAVAPGRLELVRKPIRNPGPGEVRIRVEACGVCHSDSGTVDGMFPIDWPRVPGHEAVGRIDALGPRVRGWAAGQRVGVGFLGGSCGHCDYCRGGDLVIAHGRFSGHGRPAAWIAADIVRFEDGKLVEHWDVLQDEATKAQSTSGLPMFGDRFPG
jgi:D-arabinose 1-dehydrogenase-like Zn-dependent alcohol dehydrogenase